MVTALPTPEPPLLLLPGTLCDERVFAPLMDRLPGRTTLVADLKGAGTTPSMAAKILAQAPPYFAVAGFSLGGIVALEMIAQEPDRIERIALIDTTSRPDPKANAAARRRSVERAREVGIASYIDDTWPLPVASMNAGANELRALLVDMAEKCGVAVLASQSEVAIHRADSRPRLKEITVPALVLCGAEDRVCPPELHREIASLIPCATLAIVPGAGHFAPIENPDAVALHMRDWLAAPATPSILSRV
jgi:pimeloyl-ACP methyl ester carboxylesterase